jgi:GGDEF domain-containing protein
VECQKTSGAKGVDNYLTASIGFIEDIIDKNVEEMIQEYIKKADNFLYKANKDGKGRVTGNR